MSIFDPQRSYRPGSYKKSVDVHLKPVFDASVESPALSHRVRINSIRSSDAIRNRTAIRTPDVVRSRNAVIARRFRLKTTGTLDHVVITTFFGFTVFEEER